MTWLIRNIFFNLYPGVKKKIKSVSCCMFLIKTNKRENRGEQLTCHVWGCFFPAAPCPWCCSIICFGVLILAESIIFFVVWKRSDREKNLCLLLGMPTCDFCLFGLSKCRIIKCCFSSAISYSFVGSMTTWTQRGKKMVRQRWREWKKEKVTKN